MLCAVHTLFWAWHVRVSKGMCQAKCFWPSGIMRCEPDRTYGTARGRFPGGARQDVELMLLCPDADWFAYMHMVLEHRSLPSEAKTSTT